MWRCSHVDWINVDVNMYAPHIEWMLTVNPGLAGVVAFDTEIAEPDRDGGSLRYRGVDVRELAGRVSFGDVGGVPGGTGPAASRWATCGGCPPTAPGGTGCRRPSRSRCPCTPATSGSTCR